MSRLSSGLSRVHAVLGSRIGSLIDLGLAAAPATVLAASRR